jgi:hypothetical protein
VHNRRALEPLNIKTDHPTLNTDLTCRGTGTQGQDAIGVMLLAHTIEGIATVTLTVHGSLCFTDRSNLLLYMHQCAVSFLALESWWMNVFQDTSIQVLPTPDFGGCHCARTTCSVNLMQNTGWGY